MIEDQNMLVWGEFFAYPRRYFLQIVKETLYHCNRNSQCFLWLEISSGLSDRSNLLLRSMLSSEEPCILGRGNGYLWSLFRSKDLQFLERIKTKIKKEIKEMGLQELPSDFVFNVYFYSGKSQISVHKENRFMKKWNKENDFLKVERITSEHISRRVFRGIYAALLKRVIDIIGSIFGLVIFSVAMVICAISVKFALFKWKSEQKEKGNFSQDDCSVLFKQIRVGRNGKLFRCYKFRTMYPGADKEKERLKKLQEEEEQDIIKRGPTFKMDNDPRILKFGGVFLRKHSLDELPQFFNVLMGDMSLVGPRPPTPDEVSTYLSWHYTRLSVKPGLTCFWQTNGRNDLNFEEWMRLDNKYIQERDTLKDLKLKLKTIEVMISGKGAS